MPMLSVLLFVIASLLGAQAAPAQVAPPALQKEVEAAVTAYVEGHNRLNVAALAELYSRDSAVTPVGDGEIRLGWERIRQALGQLEDLKAGGSRLDFRIGPVIVVPLGPGFALAVTAYTLTIRAGTSEVSQHGAMTLVLHKTSGGWAVIHDHTRSVKEDAGPVEGGDATEPPAVRSAKAALKSVPIRALTTAPARVSTEPPSAVCT
jgi:uncharacterized protein (TIGR02246 family)